MVDSAAGVCRMSCGCGCLTVHAEGEQCWWHGPLLRVPSGAADVRQTAALVVESTIYALAALPPRAAPSRAAAAPASRRDVTPSFASTAETWWSTVFGAITSATAIS